MNGVRTKVRAKFRSNQRKAIKLARILAVPSYRNGLLYGVAATIEHEDISFPREYRTVIDVGANKGQFALFALRRFPRAQLYCFEPLPQAYEKLTQVTTHSFRVCAEQSGIADSDGRSSFKVSHRDDSSSLHDPSPLQLQAFPDTKMVSELEINVARLDTIIPLTDLAEPFLLKIDVQGSELEVLSGAKRLLGQDGDVLVEASFAELYTNQALAADIVSVLRSTGYHLQGVYSITKDALGRPLQADFFFTRNTHR